MELAERIRSFVWLGDVFRRYHEDTKEADLLPLVNTAREAHRRNPWFTPENVRMAINNLGTALTADNIEHWLSSYAGKLSVIKGNHRVGVVMAGNIPMVGFHDFACILLSGNHLLAKLSTSDDQLIPAVAAMLRRFNPSWTDRIFFTSGILENFEANIATGSNNTSRYFRYYFGKYPHIIRKHRNSAAVLTGDESPEELSGLAGDIMNFFGMGCRNVSKLFVPEGYDFGNFLRELERYAHFSNHNKYMNNYEYSKSIFLVNGIEFLDNGFLLLTEGQPLASGIAVLHYEKYHSSEDVQASLELNRESLQCIVSSISLPISTVKPGETQKPQLWEYADGLDTVEFLLSLG